MNTRSILRAAYRVDQARRATNHPARFAKNRVKSRALRQVGFYRMMSRFWRA